MTTHSFTLSGLGQSPFKVVAPPKEDSACLTKSHETFFCEHCGTMLKNRHFVKSSDGKVSVVGVDCLKKTGDAGLIAGHKRMARESAAALREAARVADRLEREALERQALDGKTCAEVEREYGVLVERENDLLEVEVHETYAAQMLVQSNFGSDMVVNAVGGRPFTAGMLNVMTDIVTKKVSGNARKGSAAYKAALPVGEKHIKDLIAVCSRRGANIEELLAQRNEALFAVNTTVKKALRDKAGA